MILLPHVGNCLSQFPEARQILELDPDKEYPGLHEKKAIVST